MNQIKQDLEMNSTTDFFEVAGKIKEKQNRIDQNKKGFQKSKMNWWQETKDVDDQNISSESEDFD